MKINKLIEKMNKNLKILMVLLRSMMQRLIYMTILSKINNYKRMRKILMIQKEKKRRKMKIINLKLVKYGI